MINPSAVTGSEECVLKSFNSFDMRSIEVSRKYTSSSDISAVSVIRMTPVARIRSSISSLFCSHREETAVMHLFHPSDLS